MDKQAKILNIALSVAMVLIAVPAALPLLQINWAGLPYIFAVGAAAVLVVRICSRYTGTNTRVKRLHRIETISAMCYCVSAFFMFYPYSEQTDWLSFLMAGAALQVYTSFMIDAVEKKDKGPKTNINK